MKKIFLTCLAVSSLAAFNAHAAKTQIAGTDVYWEVVEEVDENNVVTDTVLKITGSGNMPVQYNSNGSNLPWKAYKNSITKIEVGGTGESVTSVSQYAFKDSANLKELSIADTVKTIGKGAFQNASAIKSISVPNSVTSIGEDAFKGASKLTYLDLGTGITTIEKHAFENATSLPALKIPSSVKTINEGAFSRAESLTQIDFGGVETIGNKSFAYAFSLKNLVISDTVKTIGGGSFVNNTGLQTLVIGNNVTTIGDKAFSLDNTYNPDPSKPYTSQLKEVTLGASLKSIGSGSFVGCPIEVLTIDPSNPNIGTVLGYFLNKTTKDENGNNVKVFDKLKTINCLNYDRATCEQMVSAATKGKIDISSYAGVGNLKMPAATTLSDADLKRAAGMAVASAFDRSSDGRLDKRIYTTTEAAAVAGNKNSVIIRYK